MKQRRGTSEKRNAQKHRSIRKQILNPWFQGVRPYLWVSKSSSPPGDSIRFRWPAGDWSRSNPAGVPGDRGNDGSTGPLIFGTETRARAHFRILLPVKPGKIWVLDSFFVEWFHLLEVELRYPRFCAKRSEVAPNTNQHFQQTFRWPWSVGLVYRFHMNPPAPFSVQEGPLWPTKCWQPCIAAAPWVFASFGASMSPCCSVNCWSTSWVAGPFGCWVRLHPWRTCMDCQWPFRLQCHGRSHRRVPLTDMSPIFCEIECHFPWIQLGFSWKLHTSTVLLELSIVTF